MHLSYFRHDVTPPPGHPLCGGWIPPVREVEDPLWLHGLVLSGPPLAAPVVLAAVDWCELRNETHARWRAVLAEAAGTPMERVAVQCVHQHDAPFADAGAERLLREAGAPGSSLDPEFCERCVQGAAAALRASREAARPVDRVGAGKARVWKVASNRRLLQPMEPGASTARVGPMRGSSCQDAALRAAPEGVVDPWLRTISFWEGNRLLAAAHHYATHPMSHYGRGRVSSDFCGLARDALAAETGAPQLYFTGAAGNVAAGKYNDGSPENRPVLRDRILAAMRASLTETVTSPLREAAWHTAELRLPPREEFTEELYQTLLHDPAGSLIDRYRGASGLSFLGWSARHPTLLSCLAVNEVRLLYLPGEPFVEYQLEAVAAYPNRQVMVAGYADCGAGYLPTSRAFPEGGYEAGWVALVGPEVEGVLSAGIRQLLDASG